MIAYTYIHLIKILFCLSLYGILVTFFQALCSCNSSQSLSTKIKTPELIIKRGNFFNTQKEYAVIGEYYHREYYYQYDELIFKKVSLDLDLECQNQISALSPENVKQFLEQGDTFPLSAMKAYELLKGQKKVQEILADTQYYQRKLLIGGYPNHNKKSFKIGVREFIDVRTSIIASFSVNAYTGVIFFEPKPFSEAYEKGLWKIPIGEWDSKLE